MAATATRMKTKRFAILNQSKAAKNIPGFRGKSFQNRTLLNEIKHQLQNSVCRVVYQSMWTCDSGSYFVCFDLSPKQRVEQFEANSFVQTVVAFCSTECYLCFLTPTSAWDRNPLFDPF